MREYISGLFLILDSRKYTSDLAYASISPYEGQQTIIIKGGNTRTSKRAGALDIGNAVKAKLYKKHHFYLTESDIVESFSFIKSSLSNIVLFQILLAVLHKTYQLPERKFFFSVYNSLLELEQSRDEERVELGLFLLTMKILNFYDILTFPIVCEVCGNNIYSGNFDMNGFFCDEHKAPIGSNFSLFTTKDRVDFLRFMLQELLNIRISFNPEVFFSR